MNNIFYVYEFEYPDGTPFYIGKGKGNRCNESLRRCIRNKLKQNVINKIITSGDEVIIKIIADNLMELVAFEIEIFLIDYYGRRDNKTGILTNLTDGGEGVSGWISTEKQRKDNSRRQKGKQLNCKIRSKPVLQFSKLGEFIKEYPSIKEASRQIGTSDSNISMCCNKKRKTVSGYIWLHKNDKKFLSKRINNTIRKIRKDKNIKRPHHSSCKKIIQYDKDGNLIKKWNSLSEAKTYLNLSSSGISQALIKNVLAGGYIWRYV